MGCPIKITHELRHFFGYRSSIGSRSVLDRFSIDLRSSSVRSPFGNRRLIEERTENHRRQNGDVSKLEWETKGKATSCVAEKY